MLLAGTGATVVVYGGGGEDGSVCFSLLLSSPCEADVCLILGSKVLTLRCGCNCCFCTGNGGCLTTSSPGTTAVLVLIPGPRDLVTTVHTLISYHNMYSIYGHLYCTGLKAK